MSSELDYVLVTPVRNEERTIGRTIQSVLRQTVLPREWVIVSDGSTDGTEKIVLRAAEEHPWVRLLQLPSHGGRSFGAVVENTEAGIRHLTFLDYEFLGLLDSDVEFQAEYFERLIERFRAEPGLGLAGGVVIDVGRPEDRFPRNRNDVPGAVQFFRKECFDGLGGLIPIPEGGWDCVTCAMARMNGYRTRLFTDLVVRHLKPRNLSAGGSVRRRWQMGLRDYAIGYHPAFEAIKCLSRMKDSPFLIGGMVWWAGFCMASARRRSRLVPQEVIEHMQSEQITRLRGFAHSRR